MTLRKARIISQVVFFSLFTGLFFLTIYPVAARFPVDAFLRLDPLAALVAATASRAFIATMSAAVVLLALTLIFGRFFCAYVCPLGTVIDFTQFILFRRFSKRESPDPKPGRKVKYLILVGVLMTALLGLNMLYAFSPMSIGPRIFTLVIFPPFVWLLNTVVDLLRPLFSFAGLDNWAQLSFKPAAFAWSFGTWALALLIIGATHWRKRFWCRYVCPTGAFLSLFSRFGGFKRKVDSAACDQCKRCMMKCDMRAINLDGHATILSECTLCGDCVAECPKNAVSIGWAGLGFCGNDPSLQMERRHFLHAAAFGLTGAAVIRTTPVNAKNRDGRLIRPPGALPETEFLARCIRCGECMKVCKTGGLQPALFESGLEGVYSPRLMPRVGGCEEKCNMCGHVCPTQAVRALPLEEKRFVKIGTAVIDRSRCIAWEQDKLCLICDEICPYDAIEFRICDNGTGPFKRPFVLEDKCTGCGLCETKCPTAGRAAIEVWSMGEERKVSGSYVTEAKKQLREVKPNQESSPAPGESLPSGFSQ